MYRITLHNGTSITVDDEGMNLVNIGQDADELDCSSLVWVTDITTGEEEEFDAQDDIAKIEDLWSSS